MNDLKHRIQETQGSETKGSLAQSRIRKYTHVDAEGRRQIEMDCEMKFE